MNESLNEPVGGRTSISDALTSTLRQPSFLRVMLVLAATVLVLVGIRLAAPLMMGRGLNISPTIVFLSFIFWAWLLGGPGAFLALPITLFVAVMLDTFPRRAGWRTSSAWLTWTPTPRMVPHRTLLPGMPGPNMRHEKNGRIDASTVGREGGSLAWNPETT